MAKNTYAEVASKLRILKTLPWSEIFMALPWPKIHLATPIALNQIGETNRKFMKIWQN